MKQRFLATAVLLVFLSGCATVQTESDFRRARHELLYGDPAVALALFQRIAQAEPDRLYFSELPEGSWTYVGRAAYSAGKLPIAHQALERAVTLHKEDDMGKLYLGLTLAREGERDKGVVNVDRGMKGLHDWLDYVNEAFRYSWGKYWDPRREIRSAIERDLKLISQNELSWPELIRDGEWVGRRVEEEIDLAHRDEQNDRNREGGDKRLP